MSNKKQKRRDLLEKQAKYWDVEAQKVHLQALAANEAGVDSSQPTRMAKSLTDMARALRLEAETGEHHCPYHLLPTRTDAETGEPLCGCKLIASSGGRYEAEAPDKGHITKT